MLNFSLVAKRRALASMGRALGLRCLLVGFSPVLRRKETFEILYCANIKPAEEKRVYDGLARSSVKNKTRFCPVLPHVLCPRDTICALILKHPHVGDVDYLDWSRITFVYTPFGNPL